MYLKNATPKRRANKRLRNWLILAIIYAITGLIWLRQEKTAALLDVIATPTQQAERTEDQQDQQDQLVEKGDIYFSQGNQIAALESYEEAVAANPQLAIAYARWGQLLTHQPGSTVQI